MQMNNLTSFGTVLTNLSQNIGSSLNRIVLLEKRVKDLEAEIAQNEPATVVKETNLDEIRTKIIEEVMVRMNDMLDTKMNMIASNVPPIETTYNVPPIETPSNLPPTTQTTPDIEDEISLEMKKKVTRKKK